MVQRSFSGHDIFCRKPLWWKDFQTSIPPGNKTVSKGHLLLQLYTKLDSSNFAEAERTRIWTFCSLYLILVTVRLWQGLPDCLGVQETKAALVGPLLPCPWYPDLCRLVFPMFMADPWVPPSGNPMIGHDAGGNTPFSGFSGPHN